MAKDKLTDYSATANSNTDIGGINIDEGCPAGNVNNAEREAMSHIAEWLAGTYPIYDTASFADPSDLTKIFRFDGGGITTSSTRVITIPDYDGTMATLAGTETLSNKTLASPTITSGITLPSGAIATAALADDAVTLAKMNAGTAGNLITYDASGDPAAVATGTSGHVLTSNGAGAAPTFQLPKGAPIAVLEDQKTAGTSGGTPATGTWTTRDLNTEVYDPQGVIALASNEFTSSVDAWVEWKTMFSNTLLTNTVLYNVTDSAAVNYGMSAYTNAVVNMVTGGGGQITAGKTYRIEYYAQNASGATLGRAFGAGTEVYTRVLIFAR